MNFQRKPHVRERSSWFLRKFFVWRVGCFEWSIQLVAVFLSLVDRINLILQILMILNDPNNFGHDIAYAGSFKNHKMHFWMIQRAKNEVFGHFLEFGLLDRLDTAYCDSTKCFPTFGKVTRSWKIIQRSQKCIFEWSKEPKTRFLAIFWSLVCWTDLIYHIMILQNVFQRLGMVTGHA